MHRLCYLRIRATEMRIGIFSPPSIGCNEVTIAQAARNISIPALPPPTHTPIERRSASAQIGSTVGADKLKRRCSCVRNSCSTAADEIILLKPFAGHCSRFEGMSISRSQCVRRAAFCDALIKLFLFYCCRRRDYRGISKNTPPP